MINESFEADWCNRVSGNMSTNGSESAYSENGCSLEHLSHERRYTFELAVASTDSTKDRIKYRDLSFATGNEATRLSHQGDDTRLDKTSARDSKTERHTHLSNICTFATHVWSSWDLGEISTCLTL